MTKFEAVVLIEDEFLGEGDEHIIREMLEDRLLNVRSDYGRFDWAEITSVKVVPRE